MAKILVVDDDAPIRALIRSIVTMLGHEVVEAENGQDALTLLGEDRFDIVLLDVMMPEIDGFGVMQRLRAHSGPLPAIVVVSAKDDARGMMMMKALGAVEYIIKPFDFTTIERTLERLLKPGLPSDEAKREMHRASAETHLSASELFDSKDDN